MIHARDDYQRIQDPAGRIPADEPVFLLRAQDKTAPDAVEAWANLQYRQGGNREMANLAMQHAHAMRAWQSTHGAKVADMPPQDAPIVMPPGMEIRPPAPIIPRAQWAKQGDNDTWPRGRCPVCGGNFFPQSADGHEVCRRSRDVYEAQKHERERGTAT